MKIYTKRGDAGETDLFGAGRVLKNDPRVEAYGTVDECNSLLGMVRAHCAGEPRLAGLAAIVERLQHELFCVGSELAAPGMLDKLPLVGEAHVAAMEQEIDTATAALPKLKHFILPAGHPAASSLHVARAVSRRAERLVVTLVNDWGVRPTVLTYLNRLSDHLFTLARWANHLTATAETEWLGRG